MISPVLCCRPRDRLRNDAARPGYGNDLAEFKLGFQKPSYYPVSPKGSEIPAVGKAGARLRMLSPAGGAHPIRLVRSFQIRLKRRKNPKRRPRLIWCRSTESCMRKQTDHHINAIKHGAFSSILILPWESRAEFARVVRRAHCRMEADWAHQAGAPSLALRRGSGVNNECKLF